jgi:hypothetical protein
MTKGDWLYCRDEIDAGYEIKRVRNGRMLELICGKKIVIKPEPPLYLRSEYKTNVHREDIFDRYRVTITKHFVSSVRFENIAGYVLWRDWYEKYTSKGGFHLRHRNEEVLGAFLNGHVIYKMSDNPSLTESQKKQFSEIFNGEISPIEQVLADAGYDPGAMDY